ncbi:hypothetical protein C4K03_1285 [Pseudomonas synxantha]|uniref:Uncharacterized protein n=1 Tax=Pseudomonas synxantha TaxID=47883 RepID=A0A3G7U4L8_9PSED|nr:hypothetical protein [Pseudomonas synxantha]AZE53456.1 hypothetical protein C4K03_1285 [Pseudomonas synxantha]
MCDYSELKRLAIAAQYDNGDYVALNDYGMAVPPAVVLALIAENERMREDACFRAVKSLRGDCKGLMAERDQLKIENEALRKNSDRWCWMRDYGYVNEPGVDHMMSLKYPGEQS